jgi:hypothetical protein
MNMNTGTGAGARPPLATWRSSSGVLPTMSTKGRDRSYSVGGGYTRIDEEMKEN